MAKRYNTFLTIAGSDSIGGAGIQADIKTATSLGVYAMSTITAVTAQNSSGIIAVEPVTPEMLRQQLSAIYADGYPGAIKIGMIPTAEIASVLADFLEDHPTPNIVIDPVMMATAGGRLADPEIIPILQQRLIPLSTLLTPNIPEAEQLSGKQISSVDDMIQVGKALSSQLCCPAVLVKGGHLTTDHLTDILVESVDDDFRISEYSHSLIPTVNTHGTGCTLSSAIASYLSLGLTLHEAVNHGIHYLQQALIAASDYSYGAPDGHGPVMHFFNLIQK